MPLYENSSPRAPQNFSFLLNKDAFMIPYVTFSKCACDQTTVKVDYLALFWKQFNSVAV